MSISQQLDIAKTRREAAEQHAVLDGIRADITRVHPENSDPIVFADLQKVCLTLCDRYGEAVDSVLDMCTRVDSLSKNLEPLLDQLIAQNKGN